MSVSEAILYSSSDLCVGDSESAKAVFLDSVLRDGDNTTSTGSDSTSLRRVLPLCSLMCPVTICYGDKRHYIVCVSGACDPIVLENAEAVEQLTKQMCSDGEDAGETMTWITMHLPFHLLQVIDNRCSFSFVCLSKNQSLFCRPVESQTGARGIPFTGPHAGCRTSEPNILYHCIFEFILV